MKLIHNKNKKKWGFNRKPLIFFFGTWFHELLFEFWVVSQKCWQKIWYFGGFMKCKNKINWNHLVPRLGPRGGAEAGAEPRGPSLGTRWFQFILFLDFMNTTKVSNFSGNIFVNTTQNLNNNPWIPGHKNKKIWVVYHEIQHWWFWTKSWHIICQYIKCELNYNQDFCSIYNSVSLILSQRKIIAFFCLYLVKNIKRLLLFLSVADFILSI